MIRNLKYRLYGCDKSRDLSELVTTANHVYNHVVALYRRFYRLYGKNPKAVLSSTTLRNSQNGTRGGV